MTKYRVNKHTGRAKQPYPNMNPLGGNGCGGLLAIPLILLFGAFQYPVLFIILFIIMIIIIAFTLKK
jgi:hypothetical protein